ncbi:hypothetical protein E7X19_23040 [Bacteroides fragilis]|nr:hypothetical protein E7X19_23040 [Bacteroides fragilis]
MIYSRSPSISKELSKNGSDIFEYIVRQVLDLLAFHHCSFIKDMPMKEVKDRDAQFKNISSIRTACWKIGFPMISIDTKRKNSLASSSATEKF